MKSIQIRKSPVNVLRKSQDSVRIQENTDQEKTPYLDTFHAMLLKIYKQSIVMI